MFQTVINYLIHFIKLWLVAGDSLTPVDICYFVVIVCSISVDVCAINLEIVGVIWIIRLGILTLLLVLRYWK